MKQHINNFKRYIAKNIMQPRKIESIILILIKFFQVQNALMEKINQSDVHVSERKKVAYYNKHINTMMFVQR